MNLSPDALRRMADAIEARNCTGIAATWCPVHGDCTCPEDATTGERTLTASGCLLHSVTSSHAEDDELVPCPCCTAPSDDPGDVRHDHTICQHVCCPDWDEE